MISESKKASLLAWLNSFSQHGVESLKQLSDGTHLCSIINSVYDKKETANINQESENSLSLEERFDYINKFINDMFHIQSDTIVSYADCQKGKEFELAKLSVFVLSGAVSYFLSAGKPELQTLTHLDSQTQQDIQECLSVIFQSTSISGDELNKVLKNPVKLRGSLGDSTPNRLSSLRSRKSQHANDTNMEESPLKSFLDSPQVREKANRMKEKDLTSRLLREEMKNEELILENKDLKEDLKKKTKEYKDLKEHFRESQNEKDQSLDELRQEHEKTIKEMDCNYKKNIESLQTKNQELQEIVKNLEEDIGNLHKEKETLCKTSVETDVKEKLQDSEVKALEYEQVIEQQKEIILQLQDKIKDLEESNAVNADKLKVADGKKVHNTSSVEFLMKCDDLKKERLRCRELELLCKKQSKCVKNVRMENEKLCLKLIEYEDRLKSYEQMREFSVIEQNAYKYMEPAPFIKSETLSPPDVSHVMESKTVVSEQLGQLWEGKSSRMQTRRSSGLQKRDSQDDYFQALNLQKTVSFNEKDLKLLQNIINEIFRLGRKCSCITENFVNIPKICSVDYSTDNPRSVEDVLNCIKCIKNIILDFEKCFSCMVESVERNKILEKRIIKIEQNRSQLESQIESLRKDIKVKDSEIQSHLENLEVTQSQLKHATEENINLQECNAELSAMNNTLSFKLNECSQELDVTKDQVMHLKHKIKKAAEHIKNEEKEKTSLLRQNKKLNEQLMISRQKEERYQSRFARVNLLMKRQVDDLNMRSLPYNTLRSKNNHLEKSLMEEREKVNKLMAYLNMPEYSTSRRKEACAAKSETSKKGKVNCDTNGSLASEATDIPGPSNNSVLMASLNKSLHGLGLQNDDEDDFFDQSSLYEIQKIPENEPNGKTRRLQELNRRNSQYLPHLRSSYPVELQGFSPACHAKRKIPDVIEGEKHKQELQNGSNSLTKKPKMEFKFPPNPFATSRSSKLTTISENTKKLYMETKRTRVVKRDSEYSNEAEK